MAFDVSRLSAAKEQREKGIVVELTDPKTGMPMDATVTVASYSSERVKAKAREITRDWEAKRKRDPKFMPTLDEQQEMTIAMACAAVITWSGLTDNGDPWPVNDENIRLLLSEPSIASQIDTVAGNEANFFTA